MNRISAVTRAIILFAGVAAAFDVWADTWTDSAGYTWTYRINGNTAEINNGYSTAISPHPYGAVTVPSSLGGKPVTSIGSSAFAWCSSLTSVTIPDSVTSIGREAFSGCSGLTSVTIPDSITSIGVAAFRDCIELANVVIGSGVTSIGDYAFEYCRKLKSVEFKGNAPPYCYNSVFYGIASGCEVIVPRNSTGWGVREGELWHGLVLRYASNVKWEIVNGELRGVELNGETAITIPSSVTKIGSYAFNCCSGLTSVTIPDSVTSIGERAFDYCHGLKSVTIGNRVTNIGNYAFLTCSSLTSITIPASVACIGKGAFAECFNLTSVLFLGSLPDCGSGAFNAVASYMNVANGCLAYVNDSETFPKDGDIWNNLTIRKIPLPRDADSLTRVAFAITDNGELTHVALNGSTFVLIPRSVTRIRYDAFDDCRDMTTVLIPSSVTSIDGGFRNCVNLTNAVIIASAMSINGYRLRIEDSMLRDCDTLTSVRIGHGITSVGGRAFADCRELTNVSIPDSVTSIDERAFEGCNGSLFDTTTIPGVKLVDGWAVDYTGSLSGALNLAGVRGIGNYAFRGCSGLTSVTIGNGVTSIGYRAFYGCGGLTSVTIPDSVTSIGESAFNGCRGLTSVTIPTSVTSVGGKAFYGCIGLTSVTIPQCVCLSQLSYAFESGCISHVVILDGVTEIGDSVFSGCIGLTNVKMPDSLTNIGQRAFYCCSNLTCLTIPSKVKNIASYAFNGCHSLSSVTVSSEVNNIGSDAFRDCSSLTNIVFEGNVPTVEQDAFTGVNPSCVVYVRKSSVGWDDDGDGRWNGLELCYIDDSPIPELNPTATDQEVAVALDGVSDVNLTANVTNAAQYAAYRTWALSVTNGTTTAQMIKESDKAWLSFALGANALIGKEITSNDVRIVAFEAVDVDSGAMGSSRPTFAFEVAIDNVNIGGGMVAVETLKENLKKVLGIEGAARLEESAFSSENVDFEIGTPKDGKATFTAKSKDAAKGDGGAFFMRVRVKQ